MSSHRTPLLNFLPLGPVTSASFPKAQAIQASPSAGNNAAPVEHKRRSSSLSSDGKSAGYRVLKVAPVHFGEHAGDHKNDWHDVEEAVE